MSSRKARKVDVNASAGQSHRLGRVSTGSHDTTSEDETLEEEEMPDTLQSVQPIDSYESEMGIIEEIYCENFMCHRKLRVQLSPHINFITGENGSGKSAIIAAIQICLGASARSTHRGKSIKNLIRHGHEGHALVRITLRNYAGKNVRASDAFRADQYGKKIMVERLIRREGSAEYRLKNEHGGLVSKLKTDLDAMLDHLNIQTENPCAILDQENAKLFLKGNPTDKYKFFLQSTDLFKMRTTYSKIDEETRAITETTLKREQIKIQSMQQAMEQAIERWEEAQSIGKLEQEFAMVKKKLAWSFVCEKEREAEKVLKKKLRKEQEVSASRSKWDETRNMVNSLETKQQQKNTQLEEINQRLRTIQRQAGQIKEQIREAKRPLHGYRAEQKQLETQRDRALQQIKRLQREIEQKRHAHEAKRRHQLQRNDALQQRMERKREELSSLQNELKDTANPRENRLDELEDQWNNCRRQLHEGQQEIDRLQNRLQGLKSQDSLTVYGHKIPQLEHLIQANLHRFTSPPIGPIGKYVTLPEHLMYSALAIEVALKGVLSSYLVVNGQDKALLDELKRRIHCPENQAQIIISKRTGQRYQNLRIVQGGLEQYTIARLLDISHPDVFNALVDISSIENKLVFQDRKHAEDEVLEGSSGSFRFKRYISEVFIQNGDKFVVRNGNLAYIVHKGHRRSSIICMDVASEKRELEQRLQYLHGDCDRMRQDEVRLRQERDHVLHQQQQQKEWMDERYRRLHQVKADLRGMEEELADDGIQNAVDTSLLEEQIEESHQEIKRIDARQAEVQELMETSHPDLEGFLQALEKCTKEEAEVGIELSELQEDVDGLYKHLSEMKGLELRLERETGAGVDDVNRRQAQLEAIQIECQDTIQKAQRLCKSEERVQVEELPGFYAKRLEDLQRKLEKERVRFQGMDLSELEMDKEMKTEQYLHKKQTYQAFTTNVERIQHMLEERKQVWQILRKEIAHRTSMGFNHFMEHSKFAGKLRFRHDDQRLDIAVIQNEPGRSRASQVTDMKELSGGERSYTQVSLLLALGQSIECPFRVMDEFDVFMDAVNRDMTIQLLVDAAKKDHKKQFIFITPNDLSALGKDPMVKIQKMDPPRDRLNAEQD